jgi:hypothetical protein
MRVRADYGFMALCLTCPMWTCLDVPTMTNHTLTIPSFDQLTTAAAILTDQAGDGMTVWAFCGHMKGDTLHVERTGTYDGINTETNTTLVDGYGKPFDAVNGSTREA